MVKMYKDHNYLEEFQSPYGDFGNVTQYFPWAFYYWDDKLQSPLWYKLLFLKGVYLTPGILVL